MTATLDAFSQFYSYQNKVEAAIKFCRQSLALREKTLGHEHPSLEPDLLELNELETRRCFSSDSNYKMQIPKLEANIQRANSIMEKYLGKESLGLVQNLLTLADLYDQENKPEKSQAVLARSISMLEKSFGKTHLSVAETSTRLADGYFRQKRSLEAISLLEKAVEIYKQYGGLDAVPPTVLNNLAYLKFSQGKYAEAEENYKQAIENHSLQMHAFTFGRWFDELGNDEAATIHYNLATLYSKLNKSMQAKEELRKAIFVKAEDAPQDFSFVAFDSYSVPPDENFYLSNFHMLATYSNLEPADLKTTNMSSGTNRFSKMVEKYSQLLKQEGKLKDAAKLRLRLVELRKRTFEGKLKLARSISREYALNPESKQDTHELNRRTFIRESSRAQEKHCTEKKCTMPNFDKAKNLLEMAVQEAKAMNPNDQRLVLTKEMLLRFLENRRDFKAAENEAKAVLQLREEMFGKKHPLVEIGLYNLAEICIKQGKFQQAEQFYKDALEISEQFFGTGTLAAAANCVSIADCCFVQERYDEAASYLKRALSIRTQALGAREPRLSKTMIALAVCYYKSGKISESREQFQNAIRVRAPFTPECRDVAMSLNNLGVLDSYDNQRDSADTNFKAALSMELNHLNKASFATLVLINRAQLSISPDIRRKTEMQLKGLVSEFKGKKTEKELFSNMTESLPGSDFYLKESRFARWLSLMPDEDKKLHRWVAESSGARFALACIYCKQLP